MATRGKSVADIAYAAGVVDSDGCIGITKRNPTPRVVALTRRTTCTYQGYVVVTNTNLSLLQWFQSEFGGSVKQRTHEKPHHKPTYNWAVTNSAAAEFCELILSYLKVKGIQAKLVMELQKVISDYDPRHGLRDTKTGRWVGVSLPPEQLQRREILYQQCKVIQDDRRPQRPSETASRTEEAMVCTDGKPSELGGTETT